MLITAREIANLSAAVQRARRLRRYSERCGLPARVETHADFETVPLTSKDDLAHMYPELERATLNATVAHHVFTSGGTTTRPRLSLIPSHLCVADIVAHWRPLGGDDVLGNLLPAGKLYSAHYFYNALAMSVGCRIVALGDIPSTDMDMWLDLIADRKITALAGTPTALKTWLGHMYDKSVGLPRLRALLWTGEPFSRDARDAVARVDPALELWGLYGSNETWVIGYNTPHCELDVFHPLPYQHVELIDRQIVITNIHPDCPNPIVRYQLGDLGEMCACPCGIAHPAFRVLGRGDDVFLVNGQCVSPQHLVEAVTQERWIREGQAVLIKRAGQPDSLEIRVLVGEPASEERLASVSRRMKERIVGFPNLADSSLRLVVVPQLQVNRRTGKTPRGIVEER